MDNIVSLFTTPDGRIGRGRWWLGAVILIVINILISIVLMPLLGVSMVPNMAALADPNADVGSISATLAAGVRTSAWISLIQFVIFAYPSYALMLKRRHDKDNNGMDAIIYLGLTGIMLVIQAIGIGFTTMEVPGAPGLAIPTPSLPLTILGVILGIYGIYMLVVLGFLRGTAGPNQYGADPLGGTT